MDRGCFVGEYGCNDLCCCQVGSKHADEDQAHIVPDPLTLKGICTLAINGILKQGPHCKGEMEVAVIIEGSHLDCVSLPIPDLNIQICRRLCRDATSI